MEDAFNLAQSHNSITVVSADITPATNAACFEPLSKLGNPMAAIASLRIRYPQMWHGLGFVGYQIVLPPLPTKLNARDWSFPYAWLEPLRWYYTHALKWPQGDETNTDAHAMQVLDQGISWAELALHFEMTTYTMLRNGGAGGPVNALSERRGA